MRKSTIIFLEAGMVLGLFASMFFAPPNMPLRTFLLIAVSVLVVCNVLIFHWAGKKQAAGKYRMGYRAYFALTLLAFYWILKFLDHRLWSCLFGIAMAPTRR
jgi:hypothetical protein